MKDKIKKNLGYKVLSIVFAFLLWWAVVNIDDPIDTKQYNVSVSILNPEQVTNKGQSFQILDDSKAIVVSVKARRKVLAKIKSGHIIATADFREMQDDSIPVRVAINGFEGSYEEVSAYPRNIQVRIENTLKKTFPITTVSTGAPRDGYVVGNMISSPRTVDISGPESAVSKISKVVAKVDVSELSSDKTIETELIYYDAADNVLDKTRFTSNCDKNGVSVTVDMWRTKNINLMFDTSKIKTASGYVFTGIEVEPQTIRVAGTSEQLNQLTQLQVPADALKIDALSENQEVVVDITNYLPEGIILADNVGKNVVVRVLVEKAGTKSLLLPVGSIQIVNTSDKFTIKKGAEQEVELQFSGTAEALEKINGNDIVVYLDLGSYDKAGIYEVEVQVKNLPDNSVYIGNVTVEVELVKK